MAATKCHYCAGEITIGVDATRDHIVPRSRRAGEFGTVLSCQPCNGRKGSQLSTCPCVQCEKALAAYAKTVKSLPRRTWIPPRLSVEAQAVEYAESHRLAERSEFMSLARAAAEACKPLEQRLNELPRSRVWSDFVRTRMAHPDER